MSKRLAGLLIATATIAGMYAIAATFATNMAASFNTVETTRHTRAGDFATSVRRASAERKTARAKCELVAAAERNSCNAEATAEQRHAWTEARSDYKGGMEYKGITVPRVGMEPAADTVVNKAKIPRHIDVALYRAHRQLPD